MWAEGHRNRGATGLWCTGGRSQDSVGDGEAGSSAADARQRRCAGVVAAGGVARGEMGEDSLDDLGSLDARDDTQCAATLLLGVEN